MIRQEMIRPVYFMHDAELDGGDKSAILEGVRELLAIGGVSGIVDVNDFGVWRNEGYRRKDGSLREFLSVDWYVHKGRETSRDGSKQLNAQTLIALINNEPWRSTPHYDLMAVSSDMYTDNTNFVIGLAIPAVGTVISTNRFKELEKKDRYECLKTGTLHELGHVFDLPTHNRVENVEHSLGKHCTNTCVMRQALTVPCDWISLSRDRLRGEALCDVCERDLKRFFGTD